MMMINSSYRLPCGLVLANRIAKSSMSEALCDERGQPTEGLLRLYRRWADGGAGLMITGNAVIDGAHVERPGNAIAEDDSAIEGLARWAKAASSKGAAVILQVSHAGRQTTRFVNRAPLAPSAVPAVKFFRAFGEPRAATLAEIADIQKKFVDVALMAEKAGFDGVQIHAAHGYLLNQFLSPLTNLRKDAYGGPVANRARLLLDIVREVRARVQPGFAVAVKLNTADFQAGAFTEDESLEVVHLLEKEGIDLLELSGGTYEKGASFGEGIVLTSREAYFLQFAKRIRQTSRIPLMVTGGFRSRVMMERALEEGACEIIGLARPLALEPDLPRRLLLDVGAASEAAVVHFAVPALRGLAEMAWYWRQLVRMSEGREPDRSLSMGWSLFVRLAADFFGARRLTRARLEGAS